ncbi:MAG: sigma-54-dependent Fis family transcriptional regulator [Ignavibacteriales bacterium]|nr:sigma-54-dependent Fis family transcriptional regulator [Ignavibacteriales bacterium]
MSKILIIDDDISIRQSLSNYITKLGHSVLTASDGENGIKLITANDPDLVISDLKMPGISGMDVLEKIKRLAPKTQFVLITAHDDFATTVEAMQKGAYDYIEKPLDLGRLKITILRALETKELNERLEIITEHAAFDSKIKFIGKSQNMREIYKQIGHISSNMVTVLIQGESGTGKELVAKSIHYSGITQQFPFIAVPFF